MGKNPEAGEATGMNFLKIALVTMAISGGLAGIAGVGEVAGIHLRLRLGVATGYGFTAIAVAYLGGLNPLGIIASSFFFAALLAGGVAINAAGLPVTIVDLFNGAILFFVLIAELLLKYKIEWRTL
jgi:simple sugar transport system permease protein